MIPIRLEPIDPDFSQLVPAYQTPGSACFDLHAALDVEIPPGDWLAVPTGVRCSEMHPDYCLLVFARSGKAAMNGITMMNGVGVIDSDYRGEIHAILFNAGQAVFSVRVGDRIAQGMIVQCHRLHGLAVVDSRRGTGGMGSTGK